MRNDTKHTGPENMKTMDIARIERVVVPTLSRGDAGASLEVTKATIDAAQLKLKDVERRLAQLEAGRTSAPAPGPRPAKAPAPAAPVKITAEDVRRHLDALPADERALVLTRASLQFPHAVPGLGQ